MPERRNDERPDAPDRRSFPRPPLWLTLLLLLLAVGGVLYARYDRRRVSTRFARVLAEEARTPADVKQIKDELAKIDLTRNSLQHELEGRMKFVASLKSENFYLSIDTRARKLRFYYGSTVLREDDITPGDARTITANGRTWTFIPLKGAFPIEAKIVGYDWRVPEWLDPARPTVPNGLGKYVIFLPNGYVIHSPPSEASPLKGPKPGSYMVSEDMMAAIWPRIHQGTQVYIY
jgi:hypothetical protein